MPDTKTRYRPAFSEQEVEALATILLEAYLADMAKPLYLPNKPADSSRAFSPEMKLAHQSLIGKINTLRTKIANNAIKPAYKTRKHPDPKLAVLETLGVNADGIAAIEGTETKEQYWERCYLKYEINPANCTVPEIDAAQEYRYLHELMTLEETASFEAKVLKGKTN